MGQSRRGNHRKVVGSVESWNKDECHWLKRQTNSHVSKSLGRGCGTSGVELSGIGLYNLGDMGGKMVSLFP